MDISKSRAAMPDALKEYDIELNSIQPPSTNECTKEDYIRFWLEVFNSPQDIMEDFIPYLSTFRIDKLVNSFDFVRRNFAPLDLGGNYKWYEALKHLMEGKRKPALVKKYLKDVRWDIT
jgi:hypothetical protein